MKLLLTSLTVLILFASALAQQSERTIRAEIVVNKNIDSVWKAWTTEEGVKSFFAPDCHVDPRASGDYEIYFNPAGEKGQRGAEGTKILALQAPRMISFTWNNPPNIPAIRWQYTSVVVRLEKLSETKTRVILVHSGFGDGKDWDESFKFFEVAWRDQVLPSLKHSLETSPIDWKNPPKVSEGAR
jgi:uncharacterized protein YndB with AHSA1/START domain